MADEDVAPVQTVPFHLGRRLSDKVFVAFHHACDIEDVEVAASLLGILENMLIRPPTAEDHSRRRRSLDNLVAAHERLWDIRHPTRNDD